MISLYAYWSGIGTHTVTEAIVDGNMAKKKLNKGRLLFLLQQVAWPSKVSFEALKFQQPIVKP